MRRNPMKKEKLEFTDPAYQPSKAELEADLSIPTTPEELLQAVINFKPTKRG